MQIDGNERCPLVHDDGRGTSNSLTGIEDGDDDDGGGDGHGDDGINGDDGYDSDGNMSISKSDCIDDTIHNARALSGKSCTYVILCTCMFVYVLYM